MISVICLLYSFLSSHSNILVNTPPTLTHLGLGEDEGPQSRGWGSGEGDFDITNKSHFSLLLGVLQNHANKYSAKWTLDQWMKARKISYIEHKMFIPVHFSYISFFSKLILLWYTKCSISLLHSKTLWLQYK